VNLFLTRDTARHLRSSSFPPLTQFQNARNASGVFQPVKELHPFLNFSSNFSSARAARFPVLFVRRVTSRVRPRLVRQINHAHRQEAYYGARDKGPGENLAHAAKYGGGPRQVKHG